MKNSRPFICITQLTFLVSEYNKNTKYTECMVAQTQKHTAMNTKEFLIYALHNLGKCESYGYNHLIRLLCNTDKHNISMNQKELMQINDLRFEDNVTFGSQYPDLVERFILDCKIV